MYSINEGNNLKTFIEIVEDIVASKGTSYMDAVIIACEKRDIEFTTANRLLNAKIRETIELEASELNMMKEKKATLPF